VIRHTSPSENNLQLTKSAETLIVHKQTQGAGILFLRGTGIYKTKSGYSCTTTSSSSVKDLRAILQVLTDRENLFWLNHNTADKRLRSGIPGCTKVDSQNKPTRLGEATAGPLSKKAINVLRHTKVSPKHEEEEEEEEV